MKGQIFTMDVLVALLLFIAASHFALTAAYGVTSAVSEDLLYRRIELAAYHTIFKLAVDDGVWACKIGDFRIPGCIKSFFSANKKDFMPETLNCAIEGSIIANNIGCSTSCPIDADILFKKDFSLCITNNDPRNCNKTNLTLCIWR